MQIGIWKIQKKIYHKNIQKILLLLQYSSLKRFGSIFKNSIFYVNPSVNILLKIIPLIYFRYFIRNISIR